MFADVHPTDTRPQTDPEPHADTAERARRARRARWAARCAALPTMRPQDIASTAAIHRRIDARKGHDTTG